MDEEGLFYSGCIFPMEKRLLRGNRIHVLVGLDTEEQKHTHRGKQKIVHFVRISNLHL